MKKYKIAIDENILVKDEICTAGSEMLYNFKPPFSATVVEKIKSAGMDIVLRSKTGEFGVGTDDNAAFAVKSGIADAALGIDVDGSAYCSAAKNGVVYIKPTYGTVSRFGLVANVASVDQIGVYAKNPDDGFEVLSIISGYDKNDGMSYPTEKYDYNAENIDLKECKAVSLTEFEADCEEIKSLGINVTSTNFGLSDYLAQVYLIISSAEFSNNISRFDGLKFGYRTENFKNVNDMIVNSRSETFSKETKIKSLMGTYVLSEGQYEKYYLKATKIRRLIKQKTEEIFEKADFILIPAPDSSCGFDNPKTYFDKLKLSAIANLTGCPSVTVPLNGGFGIQILAKQFDENKLFAVSKALLTILRGRGDR